MTARWMEEHHRDMVVISHAALERKGMLPKHGVVHGPRGRWPNTASFVERMTYKPGYEIELLISEQALIDGMALFPRDLDYAQLRIKCHIPDSTKFPHDLIPIQFQTPVPPMVEEYDDRMMRYWFQEVLHSFENHELNEWFKVDGELVNDPHK